MKRVTFNIFDKEKTQLAPSKGRILIAEPFLQGPYFSRSIIFLTEYSKEGAVGFVLNKSSDLYPDEVIEDLFNFKGELFIGGPVSSNTLHFIHRLGDQIKDSIKITDDLYWGGDFDQIKSLINANAITYKDVKFFAGYSGWSPGQLEEEIEEKSWVVSKIEDDMIMNTNPDDIWTKTVCQMGDTLKNWSNFPENPSFN